MKTVLEYMNQAGGVVTLISATLALARLLGGPFRTLRGRVDHVVLFLARTAGYDPSSQTQD
jgi:hypothetical protein